MTDDWIPGLGRQLARRAETAAYERQRHGRRRTVRTGAAVVGGALVLSSGAYAARGLWQPDLGDAPDRPVAVATAPDSDLLNNFAVLRREQTDEDRDAEAAYALRRGSQPGTQIQTNFVRTVGTTESGETIVLIPVIDATQNPQLCLWVRHAGGTGGQACTSVTDAVRGRLVIGRGSGKHNLKVVGVARDGAVEVHVGESTQRAPIADNLYQLTIPEAEAGNLEAQTFDEDGNPIDVLEPIGVRETPTPQQQVALERALRVVDLGPGSTAADYIDVARGLCNAIGASPRPTQSSLVAITIERFSAAGAQTITSQQAAAVLETVRGTFCLR